MIRLILAGLAVLLAVLAFVTGLSWMYAAAGGTGGVALGLFVYQLWLRQGGEASRRATNANNDDDEFGLSPVRPMTPPDESPEKQSGDASNEPTRQPETEEAQPEDSNSERAGSSASKPTDRDEARAATSSPGSAAPTDVEGDPRVVAFVRAVRHVLGAHTVALFVQEEMALEYRIAGLDSAEAQVQRSGTFSASTPLLTARMSHTDVTVRSLEDEPRLREALNYYMKPPSLQYVAVAPIQHAQQSATYFLLADGDANVPLPHKHTKRLLVQSADMLGRLLAYDPASLGPTVETASEPAEVPARERAVRTAPQKADREGAGRSEEDIMDTTTPSVDVERQGPRPRIEIVAEEMEVARATDIPLALALVHLNRAEMIAERGHDVVDEAEELLYQTLNEAAPHQRVERFGELTYGVFYQADVNTVESWTLDLHRGMLRVTGPLKGGVSIGVAVMATRHQTASDFRSEATEALHEAYKSGTPVIID